MSGTLPIHFPRLPRLRTLTQPQFEQLDAYGQMVLEFNRRVNLISRGSVDTIGVHHIPHALALASRDFAPGSVIVDWGTGGGLPALPLAIVFPDVTVHAVDAIEKKGLAVRAMARRLGLDNVEVWIGDAMNWPGRATHSVSRATAPLATLWEWHQRVALPYTGKEGVWSGGLICLKGGDLSAECAELEASALSDGGRLPVIETQDLHDWYDDPYFATKRIVHVYEHPN